MATNELLQKRFIYGLASEWYANKSENEKKYAGSIVFIKNDKDQTKGDAIWAQGAYFEMNNTADVQGIIEDYLEKGDNINIEVVKGKLTISAVSIDSISGLATADETKLVEAKAVAGALSAPINLSLNLSTDKKTATFAETFSTLDGKGSQLATTAVLEAGDNVSFESTATGLKIDAKDTTYTAGTGLTLAEGNVFNHTNKVEAVTEQDAQLAEETLSDSNRSFEVKAYTYDAEGHITGSVDNKITLPAEAFRDTTYEVTMAAGNSNEVSLNTKKDGQAENTYTIKGDKGSTVSFANNVMTISSETASDILGTLNVTDTAVANEYVSEVDQTNGKISVTRAKLPVVGVDETKVDGLKLSLSTDGKVGLVDDGLAADLTSKNITLETAATATEGYLKTYVLKQGTTEIGKIDLPKELVVTGGSVVEKEDGEKYLRLTIANQDTPVDIAVKDLVDVYTAGNGIVISDANVVSAQVKEGEKYLKVDENGLYTDGIDTAISTAINNLDSEKSDSAEASAKANIVNVVTGVTVKQTNGSLESVTVAETEVATAAYVDAAIAALDVDSTNTGAKNANDKGDTVTVIDQITYSETDGKVSISASTTTAATKTYVDGLIDGLDSEVTAEDSKYFTKVVIANGKLDTTNSIRANVSEAKLNGYSNTVVVGSGISSTDTINSAIAKLETTLDWGTI